MSKKSILVALISLSLFTAGESRAAFPVKKATAITTPVSSNPVATDGSAYISTNEPAVTTEASKTVTKKQSWFSKTIHKVAKKAAVSQAAYIILSIFFLGSLAIGLNDNFEGYSWLIALLLYIILWLPGFIYSLVVMGDYY